MAIVRAELRAREASTFCDKKWPLAISPYITIFYSSKRLFWDVFVKQYYN